MSKGLKQLPKSMPSTSEDIPTPIPSIINAEQTKVKVHFFGQGDLKKLQMYSPVKAGLTVKISCK